MTASSQQGEHYGADYDYDSESPHLKHRHLYEGLMSLVEEILDGIQPSGRPTEVLEIGAGDGAVSKRLLELGCDVTGTEMSQASVDSMNTRFAGSDRFRSLFDPDGNLGPLEGRQFDLILYASVLHHIPDYLAAIRNSTGRHLRPGGALVSMQDPLWYPRMSPTTLRLTHFGYLTWRLTRGNYLRGIRTRLRRVLHGISEEAAGDAVEYHVVRSGVDEEAIAGLLDSDFELVETIRYWSSQGRPQQKLGERMGMTNTFAILARDYHPRRGAERHD